MKKTIKRLARMMVLAVLIAIAIFTGAFPMNASALIFDDMEFNTSNKNYEYFKEYDILEIYGDVDSSIFKKYSDVYSIRFYETKVNTISFENCNVDYLQFERCDLSSAKIENATSVDSIYINECKMTNLTFIESAINTVDLVVCSSELGSVNGIEKLDKTESLIFSIVGIEDITPLAKLENLESLTLEYTCVSDLSPIENHNLYYLNVNNSMNIQSLDVVMNMTNLEVLLSENCEMAYSRELYNFLTQNRVENNILSSDFRIQEEVKELASQLSNGCETDEEKVEATVEYVVSIMEYDYRALEDDDLLTDYNDRALKYALDGEGVCKNYSALINALLCEMGVEVFEIRNEDHVWNIVFIDNEYFWIDATWIDDCYAVDISESIYYCDTDYYFVDHSSLTIPATVYNMRYKTNFDTYYFTPDKENIVNEFVDEEKSRDDNGINITVNKEANKEETDERKVLPEKMETRLDEDWESKTTTFENRINNMKKNLNEETNKNIISASVILIMASATVIVVLSKKVRS